MFWCSTRMCRVCKLRPQSPAIAPRLLLSSRGWAGPEPKLCARIEILVFVWRLTEIPAFRLQLSGRKPKEHHITFTLNFLNKYTGKIYSSCFLPDSCDGNAAVFPMVFRRKQEFRFQHKVSVLFCLNSYSAVSFSQNKIPELLFAPRPHCLGPFLQMALKITTHGQPKSDNYLLSMSPKRRIADAETTILL